MYGIKGQLFKAMQSLYTGNEACVTVCKEEAEWFVVTMGSRQGYVMSLCLYFFYRWGDEKSKGKGE